MRTPGFYAEASLSGPGAAFRPQAVRDQGGAAIVPAGPVYAIGDTLYCCYACGYYADGTLQYCCPPCGSYPRSSSSRGPLTVLAP
jgi:hypothetical protein